MHKERGRSIRSIEESSRKLLTYCPRIFPEPQKEAGWRDWRKRTCQMGICKLCCGEWDTVPFSNYAVKHSGKSTLLPDPVQYKWILSAKSKESSLLMALIDCLGAVAHGVIIHISWSSWQCQCVYCNHYQHIFMPWVDTHVTGKTAEWWDKPLKV